jgi:glycosyltransferase involved in cell wall biosynthesis
VDDPVTIAIPFHRGRAYLRAAIESVLGQQDQAWRLLVVDDSAGAEGAFEVVAEIGDPRIVLHRNPQNLGMVANWNRCLDLAESDLVTLLHADDRLLPNYVGLMRGLAVRHRDAAAFFCAARIIDASGNAHFSFADAIKRVFVPSVGDEIPLRGRASLAALMRGNFIMCPTLCYRKSLLAGERFAEEWRQVQDLEFTARLLLEGRSLVGSTERAYAYRRHADNATSAHSDSLLRFDEEFRLFDRIAEQADELGWDEVARVSRGKAIVRLHLAYRVVTDSLGLDFAKAGAKLRFLASRR